MSNVQGGDMGRDVIEWSGLALGDGLFFFGLSLSGLGFLLVKLAEETWDEAKRLREDAEADRKVAERLRAELLVELDRKAESFAERFRLAGMDVGGVE